MLRRRLDIFVVMLYFSLTSCVPQLQPRGPSLHEAFITDKAFVMEDSYELPYRVWGPEGEVEGVILALHGFNDYSNFFDRAGVYFAERGIRSYAYDQRGFGATRDRSIWAGQGAYISDARTVLELLYRRHEGVPLYLLGASMGGAVVLSMLAEEEVPMEVSGIILVSPAVWGRSTMNVFYRTLLSLSSTFFPGLYVRAPKGIKVIPSDNIEMMRALGRDPLYISRTRIDTLYGLISLMDTAFFAGSSLDRPTLILYGAKEQVIPSHAVSGFLTSLPERYTEVKIYEHGYHMLLRDLQAQVTWQDIETWIKKGS